MKKFIILIAVFGLVILFVACSNEKNTDGDSNELGLKSEITETIKDQKSCEAVSGIWGTVGLSTIEQCNLPTIDAGKICKDSKDCEGACIADLNDVDFEKAKTGVIYTEGKCTQYRLNVGCHPFVSEGKVEGIMCLD